MKRMTQKGFSLVELSIVLVILGLLVGGVLAGQSLIRASELRSIYVDIARYKTASGAFRDKFFFLPGDMPNATKFWGAQGGSTTSEGRDGTCAGLTTAATGVATCNGNGNGMIGDTQSSGEQYERYRFWQHLANAGLIEGQYSGVVMTGAGYANRSAIPGTNVPAGRIKNLGYGVAYNSTAPGMGNFLNVGRASNYWGGNYLENAAGVLKNEEVWNIDTKMDDGMANTGRVITPPYGQDFTLCQTSGAATANYDLTRSDNSCAFQLLNFF